MIYMPMTEAIFTDKMNQLIDQGLSKFDKEKTSPLFKYFNSDRYHFKMENDADFYVVLEMSNCIVERGRI